MPVSILVAKSGSPCGVTGGADFSAGASGALISGAFYMLYGPVTMSGAASIGNSSSGDCLELIATQIAQTGGTATGSTCTLAGVPGSGSGSSTTAISLVQ